MIHSKRSLEGYLLVDHRASPGTPDLPEGSIREAATITCSHCNVIQIVNPLRTRPRSYCSKCDHYICDGVTCNLECKPFLQILDEVEAQVRASQPPSIWLPNSGV